MESPESPNNQASHDHGSRIVLAVERAWAAIRANHPDVPHVVAITGEGDGPEGLTLGHFAANAWKANDEHVPELFTGGELIREGGRKVMETLLHEAAHGLAWARRDPVKGAQDTSNKGRYHNKRFAALARELGLTPPEKPAPVLGFSECLITEETAERYREVIEGLDAASLPYRPRRSWFGGNGGNGSSGGGGEDGEEGSGDGGQEQTVEASRDGRRHSVACQCEPPRKFQISPKAFELGDITCNVCDAVFEVLEPQPRKPRRARA